MVFLISAIAIMLCSSVALAVDMPELVFPVLLARGIHRCAVLT